MQKILVVHAIKEEHIELKSKAVEWKQIYCGIGKASATIATMKAIYEFQPDLVINIGTSGSLRHEIGSIHPCTHFIDRDMVKVKDLGVPYKLETSVSRTPIASIKALATDNLCNTGDSFLTDFDGEGDVFDMEAFAMAMACNELDIDFISIKYVTDIIGSNSVKAWEDKLADARVALQQYVDNLFDQ